MANLFALSIALHISIFDLRHHLITNRSLLLFTLPLALTPHFAEILPTVTSLLLALLLTLIFGIGGGDFKLLSLLLIMQGDLILSARYLSGLCLALLLLSSIFSLRYRSLKGSIPLAPAIIGPFLLLYLEI